MVECVFLGLLVLPEAAGRRGVAAGVGVADLAHKVGDGVATRAVIPRAIAHADDLLVNDDGAGFAVREVKSAAKTENKGGK